MLSKVFCQDNEILELLSLPGEYRKLSDDLYRLFAEVLTEHQYILSGEALRIFNNYLLITVIRSREGFAIEEMPEPVRVSRLMQKLKGRIETEIGIIFDEAELILCQKKLNESSIILGSREIADSVDIRELEQRLGLFQEKVLMKTGIRISIDYEMKRLFLLHLYKLKLRNENDVNNANFDKREINRRYPLTAHLIREWFIHIFDLDVAESEISYIILYFAAMIESEKRVVKAVYVSDQQPGMCYHAIRLLKSYFGEQLVLEETMPQYRFNRTDKKSYADKLVITTEQTVNEY